MSALPPESEQVEHWKNYRRSYRTFVDDHVSGRKPAAPVATLLVKLGRFPPLALLEKTWLVGDVWRGELTMSVRATWFVAGVLLASMFWIVLAQQSYCAGSLADWLHMGDVEECR
jgi:arginine exporter protein ArgO